jgi:hypothetical protein
MANIEETGPGANRLVFLQDATVLDWHLPAAEFDQPGPEGFVCFIKRRAFQMCDCAVGCCHKNTPMRLLKIGILLGVKVA